MRLSREAVTECGERTVESGNFPGGAGVVCFKNEAAMHDAWFVHNRMIA
jgi:hypothetical protein